MKKISILQTLVAMAAVASLAACSTPVKLDEPTPPVVDAKPAVTPPPAAMTQPQGESHITQVEIDAQQTAAVASLRSVYFDFDSYVVKDDYRNVIEAHAKRLNASPSVNLRLEGNTDERGGSEYNLALGQKRAEAVGKALSLLGVSADRYEATSYGKEHPVASGHTEADWAKNRRVDLKDK